MLVSCYYRDFCFCLSYIFSYKSDIKVKSKEWYFWQTRRQYWYKHSRGFVELYVWRAADAIVFQVCALSSRRTLDNGLFAHGISQIGINYWIRSRALSRTTYFTTWGKNIQQHLRSATATIRSTFHSAKGQGWKAGHSRSYVRSAPGKSAVENRRVCNDAKAHCHEKLNCCTVRNYSCKLGVCTRGKQVRALSWNSWNLIYIKLHFYVWSVFKPYTLLPSTG